MTFEMETDIKLNIWTIDLSSLLAVDQAVQAYIQWNLDLVTLLVTRKTVTKSRVVTKFIAYAYKVSINSKFYVGTKIVIYFFPL